MVSRNSDYFEIELGGAEEQVEITERIEVTEVFAISADHFVVRLRQNRGVAKVSLTVVPITGPTFAGA